MRDLDSNLPRVYLYGLLSEAYFIAPVLIPFYVSHGLSPTQVFAVQASYAVTVLILEIPSGYLADVVGRRRALMLGGLLFPLGIAVYALSHSFLAFVLAEVLIAVGQSLRSGTDSALIYDSLAERGEEKGYAIYEGRSQLFARAGSGVASLLGGALATVALRLPFQVNAVTSAFMFPVALGLREPRRTHLREIAPLRTIQGVATSCFRDPRKRSLVLMHGLAGAVGMTSVWAAFLFYGTVGIGVGYFGLLFAAFHLMSALGAARSGAATNRLGERRSLVVLLVPGLALLVVGFYPTPYAIPLFAVIAYVWGHSGPLLLERMNRRMAPETRATALSVANMTRSLAFAVLGPLFGSLVDRLSLPTAFLLLGAFQLACGGYILRALLGPSTDAEATSPYPG